MFHEKSKFAARGKWRGILSHFGVADSFMTGKHGPCPMCGGEDRFRWDNKEGHGTFFCNACGSGDGFRLVELMTGRAFSEIARQVDALVGNLTPETPRKEVAIEDRVAVMQRLLGGTKRAASGDLVDRYLTARGVGDTTYPSALRFGASVRDGDGGVRPCMAAIVMSPEGKCVQVHRTFLRPDGQAKAEMDAPRKLMPWEVPDGSAVRLSDYSSGPLGIAEGIETALAASILFEMPVWAALSAPVMAKWVPPESCDEVAVFGDNDLGFAGQAAAFGLGRKLVSKKIATTVHIPDLAGSDWLDVLVTRARRAA